MLFEKRYVFNAQAVAAAAHIRRYKDGPVQLETWFEGSAALPPTGGSVRSQSAAKAMHHPDHGFVMSFDSAHASVSGDFTDAALAFAHTQKQQLDRLSPVRVVSCTSVSGLNVQNRLKIRHLQSHSVADDAVNGGPMVFSAPELPQILEVEIDGKPLAIDIDHVLLAFPNKTALEAEFAGSPAFRRAYADRFYSAAGDAAEGKVPLVGGFAVASFVKGLAFPKGKPDGAELLNGNTVVLNNFGKIVFGETFVGDRKRLMTLVRLQMGSDWGGDGSFGYSGPPGGDPLP
jgi:hypothetical protein